MTPKQADLIRHSFDAIWPVRRKVAELFYRRFFELAPDAQRSFPGDMERQHLKLMDMIAAIVGALDEQSARPRLAVTKAFMLSRSAVSFGHQRERRPGLPGAARASRIRSSIAGASGGARGVYLPLAPCKLRFSVRSRSLTKDRGSLRLRRKNN